MDILWPPSTKHCVGGGFLHAVSIAATTHACIGYSQQAQNMVLTVAFCMLLVQLQPLMHGMHKAQTVTLLRPCFADNKCVSHAEMGMPASSVLGCKTDVPSCQEREPGEVNLQVVLDSKRWHSC